MLVEIGPGHPTMVRLGEFIKKGNEVLLVEANPRFAQLLQTAYPATKILHAAITENAGPVKVYEQEASSFVQGIISPAKVNDGYTENDKDAYEVRGITMDMIDPGTIDVLLADVEGSEWFCLKHLKSRPAVIILELFGWQYVNPYIREIEEWVRVNGYTYKDRDQTDALFIKSTL